jgi:hypothetical protein
MRQKGKLCVSRGANIDRGKYCAYLCIWEGKMPLNPTKKNIFFPKSIEQMECSGTDENFLLDNHLLRGNLNNNKNYEEGVK